MSQETIRLRDEAHASTINAQKALDGGEVEQSLSFSTEAEKLLARADELDSAEHKIKILQADTRDLDAKRIEVTPSETEAAQTEAEKSLNGSTYATDYKPVAWVKGLPASAQPKFVMDNAGEKHKEAARIQSDAFVKWMTYPSDEAFRNNASSDHVKAMNEGTDSQGGYYVPEEFIARSVHDPGQPSSVLRQYTTNVRVSSKDGYAPSLGAVTWAAMSEGSAPTAVTPTIGQVPFTLEKSGALIQISDELLADSAMNIPDLLAGAARESSGRYEDVNLINGTGAWGGVLIGATGVSDYTFAGASAITAADLIGLFYDLDAQWRQSDACIFLTSSPVAAYISGIGSTAAGVHAITSLNDSPSEWLLGKRAIQNDTSGNGLGAAVTTGLTTVLVGDWRQVMLFERTGFTVSRDASRYWDAGQVGFKFEFRSGSATSISTAFRKGVQA